MWQFWIDRGGTFTDVVARGPFGETIIRKVLSQSDSYKDPSVHAIRDIMGLQPDDPIPAAEIDVVKMGTTVATNALLERQGDRTVLVVTAGFAEALRIGYQNRPHIFARQIILPEQLYEQVIEIDERVSAAGEILKPIDLHKAEQDLTAAFASGIRSCAIVLMHACNFPKHEKALGRLAAEIGFEQVSVSHQVSPLIKFVSRGDTTVVDAYLTPALRRYVDVVAADLSGTRLMFMQSNGGLTEASRFRGRDSILSGPAGGMIGAIRTSEMAGFDKIITFDMGGTSTDVSHYAGDLERVYETEIAGVRLRAPMMAIHTVAAGGGSVCFFDGERYRVGPQSAGAYPGPACYRRGGPLTITDCNAMTGKLQPDFFPKVFGVDGQQPIDKELVSKKFFALAGEIEEATGDDRSPEQVAEGFLAVAVEHMANAIKKISIQKGYDVSDYTLCCFGGAGGQHACLIAAALGMSSIFIHSYAGVLSAYGMGLADVRVVRQRSIALPLSDKGTDELDRCFSLLEEEAQSELAAQSLPSMDLIFRRQLHIRYEGTDSTIPVDYAPIEQMKSGFQAAYQRRFGFTANKKSLIVESVSVELVAGTCAPAEPVRFKTGILPAQPVATVRMFSFNRWHDCPVFKREQLQPGDLIRGPAMIVEPTGTNIVEPGWQAVLTNHNHLVLTRNAASVPSSYGVIGYRQRATTQVDPVKLEIFNNLFMSIAEQMGYTLQNTSSSVNIKERLDFSCAIFDGRGRLIANAPHMPVHLGSMSESVQNLIAARGGDLRPGSVFAQNDPYNGGTHLPDITVITPVFDEAERHIFFYVASRGHHADVGGITPGSMPPNSTTLEEEGVRFDNVQIVRQGQFLEDEIKELLAKGPFPARNPEQNLADLRAQVAANERGARELRRMVEHYEVQTVLSYMQYVQDNAEAAVRRVIDHLSDGSFTYPLDDGSKINVSIRIDHAERSAIIDFSGTDAQLPNNFNAPSAICKAAVLYVFRTLVDDDLPLNYGCIKPLGIIIPDGCLLSPQYPAAVVAGNVETSQVITDAMFAALGQLAASQGTMNNFTFGNERYQYYETICGGAGAGPGFDGTDAVHTHMTNSRLTDPEILECRYPVIVESFSIRRGSGGAGKHRGGNGVIRRIRFREPMTAAILSGRRVIPPYGLAGGANAKTGSNWIQRADGTIVQLPGTAVVKMGVDDVFVIETPGGGGYGKK